MSKEIGQPRSPLATAAHDLATLVELDDEEQEILRAVEREEWVEVPAMEAEKCRVQALFQQATHTKRVTFRIAENDLYGFQIKARQEGIPYRTLITSVLHKYITGQLVPSAVLGQEEQ